MGDGKVIHLTRAPGLVILSASRGHSTGDGVVCCSIEEFLSGGDLCLFEYGVERVHLLMKHAGTCTGASSDPPEDVLHRASFLLEYGFGDYHLFENNCEDFAFYCKTGLLDFTMSCGRIEKRGTSGQTGLVFCALGTLSFIPYRILQNSFTLLAVVACGLCGLFKSRSYSGRHRSFEKVAAEKFDPMSYHRTMDDIMEKARLRQRPYRSLLIVPSVLHTAWLLNLWFWTPESGMLQFLKVAGIGTVLYFFVEDVWEIFLVASDVLNLKTNWNISDYKANIHFTIVLVCFAIYCYQDILLWVVSSFS